MTMSGPTLPSFNNLTSNFATPSNSTLQTKPSTQKMGVQSLLNNSDPTASVRTPPLTPDEQKLDQVSSHTPSPPLPSGLPSPHLSTGKDWPLYTPLSPGENPKEQEPLFPSRTHSAERQLPSISTVVAQAPRQKTSRPVDSWAQIKEVNERGNYVVHATWWTDWNKDPEAHQKALMSSNATYHSGRTPRLDALADACVDTLSKEPNTSRPERTKHVRRRPSPPPYSAKVEHKEKRKSKARRDTITSVRSASDSPQPPTRTGRTSRPSKKRARDGDESDQGPKRQRAEPKKKEREEHYTMVPDYCPRPVIEDEARVMALNPGQMALPADAAIRKDPLFAQLHPLEAALAEAHRLDGNKYLTNKRRIFVGKVRSLIRGENHFTKTHAQKCGFIDVNKSSKWWEFYQAAGWMKAEYFTQFFAEEKERMEQEEAAAAAKAAAASPNI